LKAVDRLGFFHEGFLDTIALIKIMYYLIFPSGVKFEKQFTSLKLKGFIMEEKN